MKKYIIPEIKLLRFESENVVTQASGTLSAMDKAVEAAKGIGAEKTFTVMY